MRSWKQVDYVPFLSKWWDPFFFTQNHSASLTLLISLFFFFFFLKLYIYRTIRARMEYLIQYKNNIGYIGSISFCQTNFCLYTCLTSVSMYKLNRRRLHLFFLFFLKRFTLGLFDLYFVITYY